MGAAFSCFSDETPKTKSLSKHPLRKPPPVRTRSLSRYNSVRKDSSNDPVIQRQEEVAEATLLRCQQQQQQQIGFSSLTVDGSASLRFPSKLGSKSGQFRRSASSRARSLADPQLSPHKLVNLGLNQGDLEAGHFVLVHGGGFGAWCWYKTIALLEGGGLRVTAINLMASGTSSSDANDVTSLSQYAKPLIEFFDGLLDEEKVILVGHSFGGACISYVMELFSHKILKAIFIAATMLINGQSILDVFSDEACSNALMRKAQIFVRANGNTGQPTSIDLEKSLLRDLLFNQTPAKDVALALVSMRPTPFLPMLEKLSLSESKYGKVRRFYIQTLDDNAMPVTLQEAAVKGHPPEKVFRLKGADHSPFLSKPQALHRLLIEILKIPPLSSSSSSLLCA